ncbi:glycosyltransferase family 4 protein [Clostridium sp.]|uniref:glycosyltransferase family 4 protein n=1 Tax=Clostridium sp. TaxID=1506 RepID=UPI003520FFF4
MKGVVILKDIGQKLKIAMIGHKRIPSREGGVEIVVEELSKRMVNIGHSVYAYNRKGHHVSGKEYEIVDVKLNEYEGIKIIQVPTIEAKGFAALSSSFFATIKALFGKYDVIHFHAEGPCAMLWLPKLFGKRCIATIHGLDHQRAKWGRFAKKYIMLGEKIAVKFADEIIVLSENVQSYFKDTYGRETKLIPNGVNRPEIRKVDLIEKEYGLFCSEFLLFLARLVPEKGITYLIDAFKQVKTDKKLVIAGGASDTDSFIKDLKERAKDDERIIFTGFVQGQVLEELYSNAYLYVLPSDLEGMPLSLLEAMSYGNCCLVSDIAECKEVVKDKAVLFRKSDVDDLRDKLQQLCDDAEQVQKYKEKSTDFICEKYNWDNVVKETLNLYRR